MTKSALDSVLLIFLASAGSCYARSVLPLWNPGSWCPWIMWGFQGQALARVAEPWWRWTWRQDTLWCSNSGSNSSTGTCNAGKNVRPTCWQNAEPLRWWRNTIRRTTPSVFQYAPTSKPFLRWLPDTRWVWLSTTRWCSRWHEPSTSSYDSANRRME